MRYSFHGKVRANGQQVDGFVEAANATEAIDRLADRGIIGVYSVRPEARPLKNAVTLSGEAEPEEPRRTAQSSQLSSQNPRLQRSPTVVPKRIPPSPVKPVVATKSAAAPASSAQAPVVAPASVPTTPEPAPAVVTAGTETMLLEMMERLTTLMGRVEQALSRPTVMYQAGPVRGSGFSPAKKSGRIPLEVQSSTLHDIFKNNLDLRKSLDKLADTVGTPVREMPVRELVTRENVNREFVDSDDVDVDIKTKDGGVKDGGAQENGSGLHLVPPVFSNVTNNGSNAQREGVNGRESLREAPRPPREQAAVVQKLAAQVVQPA